MFCGTGSFSHVDDDDETSPAPASPSRGRRKHSSNNNPYSSRGLDKFSTVLAELGARRDKIMAMAGSRGVSIVRFVYSSSQDWVPIVVRPKDPVLPSPPPPEKETAAAAKKLSEVTAGEDSVSSPPPPPPPPSTCGVMGSVFMWRPSYYWPVVVLLILVCLVTFGRAFAICCTSIWWYLVPTMKGHIGKTRSLNNNNNNNKVRSSMKKKDYGRRMSEKRLGDGAL